MEFENSDTMDKYHPMGTVKQELIDSVNGVSDESDVIMMSNEKNEINSATGNSTVAETNTPVCDSAEKQVGFFVLFFKHFQTFQDEFIDF